MENNFREDNEIQFVYYVIEKKYINQPGNEEVILLYRNEGPLIEGIRSTMWNFQ